MNPFKWALSALLALSISGCSIYSISEVEHMQANLSEISLELNRLKTQMNDNDKKMIYALMSIEERPNALEPGFYPADSSIPSAEIPEIEEPAVEPSPVPEVPAAVSPDTEAISATDIPPDIEIIDSTLSPEFEPVKLPEEKEVETAASAPAEEPEKKDAEPAEPETEEKKEEKAVAESDEPSPSADEILESATEAWQAGETEDAREHFELFLSDYPNHPDAGEASFWIGECLYLKKRFPEAIQAYELVLGEYAGSAREAEAAAKIGYCYLYQEDRDKAREALEKVVRDYPSYERLSSVQQMLDSLK